MQWSMIGETGETRKTPKLILMILLLNDIQLNVITSHLMNFLLRYMRRTITDKFK